MERSRRVAEVRDHVCSSSQREWIARRLRFVPEPARDHLAIVALLGAPVSAPIFHAIASQLGLAGNAEHLAMLGSTGWLLGAPPGFYALPSRTHREEVLAAVSDEKTSRWHAAASIVIAESGGVLTAAEGARHAALAGDSSRAVELALVAARASRELHLDAAAEALFEFAGHAPQRSDPPVAGSSEPPSLRPRPGRAPARARRPNPSRHRAPPGPSPSRLFFGSIRSSRRCEPVSSPKRPPTASMPWWPFAKGQRSTPSRVYAKGWRSRLTRALLCARGPRWPTELRSPRRGARFEALLSTLDALARAREANEPLGERACARFLRRLSLAAGHPGAALKWQTLAEQKTP